MIEMTSAAQPTARSARRFSPGAPRLPWVARLRQLLSREIRLALTRLRHPRASFGAKTDVCARFLLRQSAGASCEIGRDCVLDNDLTLVCRGTLRVGHGTIFGHHCTLAALESITIGPDCLIAELVSIRDHDHCFDQLDVPYRDQGMVIAPVSIGRNVWLGAKVTVAAGVTIGDNTVVGANAVVTKDLPANCVAVGVPARVVRHRLDASSADPSCAT